MLSTLALATMIPTAFISIDTSPFFYNDLIAVQAMMRPHLLRRGAAPTVSA